VDSPRDAAACGEQRVNGYRIGVAGRGVQARDQPHGLRVEWLERDRVSRLEPRQPRRLLTRGEDEDRQRVELADELAQRAVHLGGCAVGVVEDEQRRPPRIERPCDRGERRFGRSGSGRVEHARRFAVGVAGDRRSHAGLAHPVPADDGHERARAGRGPLPMRVQPPQLVVAAGQRSGGRGVELAWKLRGGRLDVQRRVLTPGSRRAGAGAAAPARPRSPRPACAWRAGRPRARVGLPPAPIEREHPLRVQPLTQRVLGHQRVDLARDLLMASSGQVRIDRQLRGRLAQLFEPPDLGDRKRLGGQIGQRVAAK
jgi:hypothetical protein